MKVYAVVDVKNYFRLKIGEILLLPKKFTIMHKLQ